MHSRQQYSVAQQKATIKLANELFSAHFEKDMLQLNFGEIIIVKALFPLEESGHGKPVKEIVLQKLLEKIKSNGCEVSYTDPTRDQYYYVFTIKRLIITTLFDAYVL